MKRLSDDNDDDRVEPPLKRLATVKKAYAYLQQVRTAFNDVQCEKYKAFLVIIKECGARTVDMATTVARMKDLFKDHKNLLFGFSTFLPEQHKIHFDEDGQTLLNNSTNAVLQKAIDFVNNVRVQFKDHEDVYESFLGSLLVCRNGTANFPDIYRGVAAVLSSHPDLLQEFNKFVGDSVEANKCFEIDLSNCETCTPSYYCLPKDYPILSGGKIAEVGEQVLNDSSVCVNPNYWAKPRSIFKDEEILLNYEDIRFGFDLLVSSFRSAAKQGVDLLVCVNGDGFIQGNLINIKQWFTLRSLRCIERVFGEQYLDIMNFLHKNPVVALTTIVFRLKQKEEELIRHRSGFDKVYGKVSGEIQKKGSRRLSTKSWMGKIKDMEKIMQKEHDAIF